MTDVTAYISAIFVLACLLSLLVTRGPYRRWLDRRHAADRADERELREWSAAIREAMKPRTGGVCDPLKNWTTRNGRPIDWDAVHTNAENARQVYDGTTAGMVYQMQDRLDALKRDVLAEVTTERERLRREAYGEDISAETVANARWVVDTYVPDDFDDTGMDELPYVAGMERPLLSERHPEFFGRDDVPHVEFIDDSWPDSDV